MRSGWAEATRISVKCLSKRGYDMTGGYRSNFIASLKWKISHISDIERFAASAERKGKRQLFCAAFFACPFLRALIRAEAEALHGRLCDLSHLREKI